VGVCGFLVVEVVPLVLCGGLLCEYIVLVLCFYLGNLICGLCAVEFFTFRTSDDLPVIFASLLGSFCFLARGG
jgi:hypothetical protein